MWEAKPRGCAGGAAATFELLARRSDNATGDGMRKSQTMMAMIAPVQELNSTSNLLPHTRLTDQTANGESGEVQSGKQV